MTIKRAVILAAGSARRLKPLTDNRPKCMLDVGGAPILQHQVAALRGCGVDDVAVVTGFCAETIRDLLGNSVSYVHNADYDTTNSVYSLWLGREHLRGGGLILNSDVLFHPASLRRLLDEPSGNCLLFDASAGKGDAEAMKILLNGDGTILRLSKALPDSKCNGENLGVIRVDEAGAKAMDSALEALIASNVRRAWVPEVINEMRPVQHVKAVAIAEPWIEIDTPDDLEIARTEIWPQIAEAL